MKRAQVLSAIKRLAALRFFPAEPEARGAIVELIEAHYKTEAQLDVQISRFIETHNEWPGPAALVEAAKPKSVLPDAPSYGPKLEPECRVCFDWGVLQGPGGARRCDCTAGAEAAQVYIDTLNNMHALKKRERAEIAFVSARLVPPLLNPITQADIDAALVARKSGATDV